MKFAEKLQANRMQLQQQALNDMFTMSHTLLNESPYESFIGSKQPKGTSKWITAGLPIAGGLIGGLAGTAFPAIGTLAGAAAGSSIGSTFASGFGSGQSPKTDWSGIAKLMPGTWNPTQWENPND